jgi:hypothetical protein
MPNRPPREWFRGCTEAVEARGGAHDPKAVCGAQWANKDEDEKRAIVRAEGREGSMTTKRKKSAKKRAKRKAPIRRAKKTARAYHPKKAGKKRARKKQERHLAARHAAETREFLRRMHRIASGR